MRVDPYAERKRGQRSGPSKLMRYPLDIVKFESREGARLFGRLGREPEHLLLGPDLPFTIKLAFINV